MDLEKDREDLWKYLHDLTAELRILQQRVKALEDNRKLLP